MPKLNTEDTDNPICPYCKDEWEEYDPILFDSDFKREDEILVECPNCGNTYILNYKIDVTYSTSLFDVRKGKTLSERKRISWKNFLKILDENKCEYPSFPDLYFFELPENLYWIDGTYINPYNDPIMWIPKNKFPCQNLMDFVKDMKEISHRDIDFLFPNLLDEFKKLGIGRR